MSYYDFFIFITRFALANCCLLYHLRNGDASQPQSKACSLISNLLSIRVVVSRMMSAEAFDEENLKRCAEGGFCVFADIKKNTGEEDFLKLCTAISRTYETIEEGQGRYCNEKDMLKFSMAEMLEVIEACGSGICTPEDLVKLIDLAISNHNTVCKDYDFRLQSDFCDSEALGIERMVL